LMTNYDGVYLGDRRLEPVMEELNRRGAVVALHPTSPPGSEAVALGRSRPLIEFIFDTTRAVVNLILTGTLQRHPRLKIIVPHVGSALPSVADRVNGFAKLPSTDTPLQKIDVYGTLARLHYDVAGTPLPRALPGLLAITSADQLLYASDTPFTPPNLIQAGARALLETDVLDDTQRRGLFSDNAEQLFPRLARSLA
jgi:predicted TIM-barrel fold metal-dependent hydrolase